MTTKQELGFLMLESENLEQYKSLLVYIVYKTIVANCNITLAKLEWLMKTQFFIPADKLKSVLVTLTQPSMFNCVKRWQPPDKDIVHLSCKENPEFEKWLLDLEVKYPALKEFIAPVFGKKGNK